MNEKQSQSGFAHLAIIIVLVVTSLGAIGFVYYQNFIQKKDSVTVSDTTTVKTDVNKGYLVLDDWNVKFKLPTDLESTITYDMAGDSTWGNYYNFTTVRAAALGSGCAVLNSLHRSTELKSFEVSPPTMIGKIGDYYYYLYRQLGVCADNPETDTDIQLRSEAMLTKLLTNIESK